ncbi:MAG TPA: HAMP domain-containing sensor histidine kinase [Candidatus Dormibacteraeota bacterium]|nr:HAMP domain-containing sensor histidine kinase [Candidatus Dormibacteraeota bacterium]
MLAVIPLVASAWLFGLRGGLIMAILIMVPTAYVAGVLLSPPQPFAAHWPNYAAGLLLAGGTVAAQALVRRLDWEISTRTEAEQQQQLAQKLLAQTHRQLRAVLEKAPVVLFAVDSAGIVTLAEGRLDVVLGVSPVDPVGRRASEILTDLPELAHHLRRGLEGASHTGVIEVRDGAVYLDITYTQIQDESGVVLGVGGTIANVTERVRSAQLEREGEVKSRIMATMNHEVRSPLTAILGFAELLSTERRGPLNLDQRRYLENIETGGRHLLSLVNDSLDLSRMEAGMMVLEPVKLSVRQMLQEAVEQVQPLAEARDIQINLECSSNVTVHADARRLLQVVWNLVTNAIKFTPIGGSIWLSGQDAGALTRIEVRDSGPGIPSSHLESIFEEFIQVGTAGEGTGLGLAITRQLVVLMGGKITVESHLGQGTSFTLDLPPGREAPDATGGGRVFAGSPERASQDEESADAQNP